MIEEIVQKLTKAHCDALRGVWSWSGIVEAERGEEELYALGLWNRRPKRNEPLLTPLGLAVKARLGGTQ